MAVILRRVIPATQIAGITVKERNHCPLASPDK
ncbi:MAG: hypothetical protein, partial [Olavius algarvensis spirochete endosymbiont]